MSDVRQQTQQASGTGHQASGQYTRSCVRGGTHGAPCADERASGTGHRATGAPGSSTSVDVCEDCFGEYTPRTHITPWFVGLLLITIFVLAIGAFRAESRRQAASGTRSVTTENTTTFDAPGHDDGHAPGIVSSPR